MKKIIIAFCLLYMMSISKTFAQDYKNSIGLRVSPYYGVTFKHFLNETRAVEGILATRRKGISVTGLYEIHIPAFSTERLKAYGGIGGHVNLFKAREKGSWLWDHDDDNDDDGILLKNDRHLTIGIDMILGIEYTFEKLPFNLGLDWKPALNLFGDHGFSGDQLALSFRFVF